MLMNPKNISKQDTLKYLEYGKMKKETLKLFNAKYYRNDEIAVLENVVLLRENHDIYKVMPNFILKNSLHNPTIENGLKIEITLSLLNTDEEKLERLEQLIKGW